MPIDRQLRVAVCDDTPDDRAAMVRMLQTYADQHDHLIETIEYSSGEELLAAGDIACSLIILDIFMGELNGIQTARRLMEVHPGAKVIFCSTTNEFAAESYDVDALRYLTKPVSEQKLFQTLDKYLLAHTALRTLTYRRNRMEETVYLSEVLWIEADRQKCILHTKQGDIPTTTPFQQFCERLKDSAFVKPIRYALVSLPAIAVPPTDVIRLTDGSTIPVSRDQRQEMKQAYTNYKMNVLLKKGGLL